MNLNFCREMRDLLIVKKTDTFTVIIDVTVKKIDTGSAATRPALLLPFISVCIL
jgi:hypothetical protein